MKRILSLAAVTIVICLITTVSFGQAENLKLRFHVPFPFTAENATFEAGDYEVTEPGHLVLELRNVATQAAAFEHARPAGSEPKANGRVRLIFHRYGGTYFLAGVSDGSLASTYDLRPSKEEQALASPKAQSKIVNVMVDGSVATNNTGPK